MFENYFKMAWRSLVKNKLSSIINIGGLAVGLATSILIMLLVTDEYSFDHFHRNLADIYLLMRNQEQADGVSTGDATPGPLAGALRNQIPETKYVARLAYFGHQLTTVNNKSIYTSGIYAEPDLFNMMSFPAEEGNAVMALQDASSVLITNQTAKKLFGNENPLGKTITYDHTNVFKVGAVLKDIPANSSIQFDMVLPFDFFEPRNAWLNKWDDDRINTWVQFKPGARVEVVNKKLTSILQTKSNDTSANLFAYPLAAKRLHGHFTNGKPSGGRIYMVAMLAMLGLFILLIACVNFMNLSTARSEHRAREVGVRKVLGASRQRIILQFFSEAILLTFLALLLSLLLAQLALPYFNEISSKSLAFNFLSLRSWLLLLGIGLFTGLVAGSYPAVFLSRFKTTKVLKGITKNGKSGGRLRSGLVTFQFIISIFLIVSTIVVYTQVNHVKNRPLGYDQENLIDVAATGELATNFQVFRNELASIKGIVNTSAGSDNILQFGGAVTGMDWPGKIPGHEVTVVVTGVEYEWIKTVGLKLNAGRDFSRAFGTDTAACLLNQAAVEKMGLKEPVVGQLVGGKTVIGIVQDFVYNNPSGTIAPMAIYLNTGGLSHFFVRIQNNNQWRQTIEQVEKVAKKLNPGYPFEYAFTKEDYQKRFEEFSAFGWLAALFGGMAIFISCLGLYGLSAFLAEKRSKEMSIRKVLGASLHDVWLSLSRDFLQPVIIAFLLVVPLAAWVLQSVLANMAYHINVRWWMFAAAGLLSVLIALLTVSYQGIKTALENPVRNLKNE